MITDRPKRQGRWHEHIKDGLSATMRSREGNFRLPQGKVQRSGVTRLTSVFTAQQKTQQSVTGDSTMKTLPKNLNEMISRVKALLSLDETEDDFVMPAKDVADYVIALLRRSVSNLGESYPKGGAFPDGNGGIRLEWRLNGHHLRLVVPRFGTHSPYIYSSSPDGYKSDYDVTPKKIGEYIGRFKERTSTIES